MARPPVARWDMICIVSVRTANRFLFPIGTDEKVRGWLPLDIWRPCAICHRMTLLEALLPIGLGAVLIVLGLGLYTLVRGQSNTQLNSNQLMRLRVLLQTVAVIALLTWFWMKTRGAG